MKPSSRGIEESFSQALDEAWSTNDAIAEAMTDIAFNSMKMIKNEYDELIPVPDYTNRVKMLNMILKSKWLLEWKEQKTEDPLDAIYVFVKN